MHSSIGEYGGDLKTDTVTIIGGALDLQEKVNKLSLLYDGHSDIMQLRW